MTCVVIRWLSLARRDASFSECSCDDAYSIRLATFSAGRVEAGSAVPVVVGTTSRPPADVKDPTTPRAKETMMMIII
jgi:hypothetical protein